MSTVSEAMAWLLAPISGSSEHTIAANVAWHGRLMVLVWAFVVPVAIVISRYFKITPRQRWPRRLDNPFWFITHRRLGNLAIAVATLAVALVLFAGHPFRFAGGVHAWLGWVVLLLGWGQIVGAYQRGTHGGPIDPFTRERRPPEQWPGDHFSMTRRRVVFEYTHKIAGYVVVILCVGTIFTGLRQADAPRWMWIAIAAWWIVAVLAYAVLQRRVGCIDTYQAIWGLDRSLPGYRRAPIGLGITRYVDGNAADAPWQRRQDGNNEHH